MMPTATATPQRLKGMVAVSKDSNVKPLGYITWFSVPDENVPLSRLRKAWGLSGLETRVLPRDQRAVNIFKRAVRDQQGRFVNEDGSVRETDVRDVLENEQDVIYQITEVTRDEAEQRVLYAAGLRVWFNKSTQDIGFKPLEGLTRREVLAVMERIQASFDDNAKTVTGSKVRTLVRSYIKDEPDEGWVDDKTGKRVGQQYGLSGENLRGKAGGVYFVLAKHADQLEAMAEMLNELYRPHGRAYLYTVPLADSAGERELIRRHLVANAQADVKEAINEVRKLLRVGEFADLPERERAVRENVIKHHYSKLERLKRRAAQYNTALQEEEEDVQTAIDMLGRQLRKLVAL